MLPKLVGTGTEDYIGSGWGQGEYRGRLHGSLISDDKNDLYAFYRFHLADPVYFHQNCRVTIQQIGNTSTTRVREMQAKGVELKPVWVLHTHGCNFYRRDDVSATVYFYLDRPENELPPPAPAEQRMQDMREKVWSKAKR